MPAQILLPGTFVATTLDPTTIATATSTVQVIDPFSKKTTALAIKNFPAATTEGPDAVWIESPASMVLGTRATGTGTGNIYRAQYSPTGWFATKLNTTSSMTASVSSLVSLGGTIYFAGTAAVGSSGTSALLLSMPAKGGAVKLYVDVGKAGSMGLGNALTAVGNILHFFTFDSTATTTGASEHWTIDTSATVPTAVRVGALPMSKQLPTSHFGVVQADYDAVSKLLVVGGVFGDVVWRTPAGKDVRHVVAGGTTVNYIDAVAVNTDTGTVGIGDRSGHYEELRGDGTLFKDTYITLPAPITAATRVSNLAYMGGAAKYLPTGPGCKQASGATPCNYVNSLPAKGNAAFTITLEAVTKRALLVVGLTRNTTPFDMRAMGAPRCYLYQSLEVLVPGTITSTGATVGPLAIPRLSPDVTVFTQWLLTDSVNAMGVVVSDGRQLDVR
jgi:hypothetical protein